MNGNPFGCRDSAGPRGHSFGVTAEPDPLVTLEGPGQADCGWQAVSLCWGHPERASAKLASCVPAQGRAQGTWHGEISVLWLGGQRGSNPAAFFVLQERFPLVRRFSPHPHLRLPLQSLPSLTPSEFTLKALFKASQKGLHNVFQQEPSEKKNPLLYYPSWRKLCFSAL